MAEGDFEFTHYSRLAWLMEGLSLLTMPCLAFTILTFILAVEGSPWRWL